MSDRIVIVWYQDATDDPDNPFTVVWKGAHMQTEDGFVVLTGGKYRLYESRDLEWEPMPDTETLAVPLRYVLLIREVLGDIEWHAESRVA